MADRKVNMAYRTLDVKVDKIDIYTNKMVIKKPCLKSQKNSRLKTVFKLDNNTIITGKDNHSLKLSDIKIGKRVSVDFIKTDDKKFLAKGIIVLN